MRKLALEKINIAVKRRVSIKIGGHLVQDRLVPAYLRKTHHPRHRLAPTPAKVKSLLVWNLNYMGDALWTTPLLRALRQGYPSAHIVIICLPGFEDLFTTNPHIDRVLPTPFANVVSIWGQVRIPDVLRAFSFDVMVIADMNSGSADIARRLSRKIGVQYVVSSNLGRLKFLPDYTLPPNDESMSAYWPSYFLRLAEHLALPSVPAQLEVFPVAADAVKVDIIMEELRLGDFKLIGMHIGTAKYGNGMTKQWPLHKFVDLAKQLTEKDKSLRIVLTGSQSEYREVETVQAAINADKADPIAVNLAGAFSLRELAVMLQRMAVVVVADTGILHLAAAVGTPTVALFGPTDPHMIAPKGMQHATITGELPCSPCFAYLDRSDGWKPCIHPKQLCMAAITVEQIATHVRPLLTSHRRGILSISVVQH